MDRHELHAPEARDWAHLERAARLLYPQLEGVEYEYRWAGRIAIKPIPLHALQRGYINAGVAWYGLRDALS